MKANASKPLSLRFNFSLNFLANAIYSASQWGMLLVLAKLGSPQMVGEFTLALSITAPLVLLTDLQLRTVQGTDVKGDFQFGTYVSLRLIGVLITILFLLSFLSFSDYRGSLMWVIFVMGVAKMIETCSDLFYGLFQRHERMDRIAFSIMMKGPLSLLVVGLFVWYTSQLLLGVIGMAVIWLLIFLVYDLPNAKRFEFVRLDMSVPQLKKLFRLSLPLGVVMMLISLNTNIPRYFIEHSLGTEELGYFSALFYLLVAGNIVVSAAGQAASPRLAQYYARGEVRAYWSLLRKLVGGGVLLGSIGFLCALLFGDTILSLLYQPEYAQFSNVFTLLMLAGILLYSASFMSIGLTAMRKFRIQPVMAALFVAVSFLAALILIPRYHLEGAAYAVLIASAVQLVLVAAIIRYYMKKLT